MTRPFLVLIATAALSAGCQSDPEPPPSAPPVQGIPSHVSCGTSSADAVLQRNERNGAAVDTAQALHNSCPGSFVVDISGAWDAAFDGAQQFGVTAQVDERFDDDPAGCAAAWMKVSLWKKQGSSYTRLRGETIRGSYCRRA